MSELAKGQDPLGLALEQCEKDLKQAKTPSSRAQVLTRRANVYAQFRKQELAFRDLKEAISLTPQNADIAETMRRLQSMSLEETIEDPGGLLEKFLGGDSGAGKRIVSSLGSEPFAKKMAEGDQLKSLLVKGVRVDSKTTGLILLKLSMSKSEDTSAELVKNISPDVSNYTGAFVDCGPQGVEALTNILLKRWDNDNHRRNTILQALIQLAEHLLHATDEPNQIALLNSLIRLASHEQHILKPFDINVPFMFNLLSQLRPDPVRSRAIVLLSTLISKEDAESPLLATMKSQLADFITSHLSGTSATEYVTAFSVLTSVFTVRADIAAQIFLQDGFLEEAVEDSLEVGNEISVQKALLELLSAAIVDKNSRTKITKVAEEFLVECSQSEETEIRALAGSVLAKLSSASVENRHAEVDLLKIFKDAKASQNEGALLSAVEGLTFSSTAAVTKDTLCKDIDFLNSLHLILKSSGRSHPLIYGCLSILVNLTTYKPALTEEQKRIDEIRRLAKDSDVHTIDELDTDIHVTARCKALLAVGLLPTLNAMATTSSPACITAISQILLSTATNPTHRGILAHQGAIKLLLALLSKSLDLETEITLSHGLAKILISVNPALVFSSRTPITAPIKPLTTLLSNESLPNELPRFETLLALTNLASADDSARNAIIEKSWSIIETLLLCDTPLIQRAATELVCNLVVCQRGAEKFIPSTANTSASGRLHLLLALADVDDVATRRAAGGALAMLTDFAKVCEGIGKVERGVERVGGMVGDVDDDVAFRGVVCVGNLIGNGGGDIKTHVLEIGMGEKVKAFLGRTGDERMKGLCREVLASFVA